MNKTRSVSNCDIIDSKLEEHQLCGSKQCPSCGQKLQGKPDWVGLPAGVKFDPTDMELMQHLEAKVMQAGRESKSHPLIDEFIPTIEGEDGICYTHPQNLPGVREDGLSRHFFHRPSKAYTTGTRKRRKILMDEHDLGETRWHKTGKTRPVMVNGKQKGCKKILVLYTNFGKNRKPLKTNWVMHQYHLGKNEEEKEGELVVSKVFYQTQPRHSWLSDQRGTSGNKDNRDSKDVGRPRISGYGAVDVQQLKHDRFGIISFEKSFESFDRAGNIGEASTAREAQGAAGTRGVRDMGYHHVTQEHELPQHHVTNEQQYPHGQIANAAAVDMSSISSSIILSPTPTVSSIILDEDHSFNVPRFVLPNQNFQQQQQHDKIGEIRSASGLDELIMACTSSTHHAKQESSIKNPQEAEWFKYSTMFWPDQDHHHG
ncbi:hypothetical protein CDL12_13032 [Handroanthus impetiginosus]|uniref:NAC domain-containing protein n=1 Tax=Handroanthus impetiginosus TaxID=429701 RepID=A0A2G9H9Z1_9LAMI|nr:hypothetical protein CDL12_13032 [Handroanthus impetiginosus]